MLIKANQIKEGYKIRIGSNWEVVESTSHNDTSSIFFEDHENVMVIKRSN